MAERLNDSGIDPLYDEELARIIDERGGRENVTWEDIRLASERAQARLSQESTSEEQHE